MKILAEGVANTRSRKAHALAANRKPESSEARLACAAMCNRRPALRYFILAASMIALAAPAAQPQSSPSYPREMDRDIVRSLPAPDEVEDMAGVAGRAAEAILDVPIGGVVRAIDPTRRVPRDATVGEMAGRDDPYLRERVRDSVDGLAIGMGDMIAQVAVIAPELRRALTGVELSLERAIRTGRDRDGDRRDRDYHRDYEDDYEYRR